MNNKQIMNVLKIKELELFMMNIQVDSMDYFKY
jgi:hypothetical protein